MSCFTLFNRTGTAFDQIQLLFYALSLFQAYRGLQLARSIQQNWHTIKQEPLTWQKAHFAGQAAFYLAVPPAVFVHELFHAIPIWVFGGRVVECGYGFYWGYVQADRFFLPSQEWFISLAGTLGSLAFGLLLWLLLHRHPISAWRYFAFRAFHFQILFSLIYYPIFTAISFIGDWRTIYNFNATPGLSAATAVTHVGLLLLFRRADRRGWFEMPRFESQAERVAFDELAHQATVNPQDGLLPLRYIERLRHHGAPNKATHQLKQFLKQHPNSAEAHIQLAILQSKDQNHITRRSKESAEKALHLGISVEPSLVMAHQILGQYAMERERMEQAINHFSEAIATAVTKPTEAEEIPVHRQLHNARLYHLRSRAYRRLGQFDAAYKDIQQALALAQATANERQITYYQRELEILEKHAGRPLGMPPTNTP
jgi:tetratricopeptide (TPR) repeat protein